MNEDLKKIKKRYGEGMAKLSRDLFPTLIEKGILFDILESSFQENKYLSEDIIENRLEDEFRDYINSKMEEENIKNISTDKKPSELLRMAGYQLFKCKTEEDIQLFKHYYKPCEELCTFKGGRLKSNHVFFAIKKNVDKIKRENFIEPLRQDEYGTSVISIQFRKKSPNYLSIKNRYNHIVQNCDSTFSNNLDNIIEGLNKSFEKEYNLDFAKYVCDFEIPNYVKAEDGKFYKYNYEINNIYYCPNNVIIDNGKVKEYDRDRYLLFDYFLMDLKNKNISLYDKDIFEGLFNYLKDIDKIEIKNLDTSEIKKGEKEIVIKRKDETKIKLKTNKHNQIISLDSDDIIEVGDDFLYENKYLSDIRLLLVKSIKNSFLEKNKVLTEISLPSVQTIGNLFAFYNSKLQKIDLPLVKEIGNKFLMTNEIIDEVKTPLLETIGDGFLGYNRNLTNLNLPLVKEIGDRFLMVNEIIDDIRVPLLEKVGDRFLGFNKSLIKLSLPTVKEIGNGFLWHNEILDDIRAPLLETVESNFLGYNRNLVNLNLPSLKRIGNQSFYRNNSLTNLNFPELEDIGKDTFKNHSLYKGITVEKLQKLSEKDESKRVEEQVVLKDNNKAKDKYKNKDKEVRDERTI